MNLFNLLTWPVHGTPCRRAVATPYDLNDSSSFFKLAVLHKKLINIEYDSN